MPQSLRPARRWIVLTLAAASAAPIPWSVLAADAPAAQPAASAASALSPATQKRIADAIDLLGSDDFKAREEAAKTLLEVGEAAIPALKEAAHSDNPEIARRSRMILGNFTFGVRPDTPQAVVDQLNIYRRGADQEKRDAIGELTRLGVAGARVLAKIAHDEQDAELKKIALNGLTIVARPMGAAMMHQGDFEMAGYIFAAIAHQDEAPARDAAAYLLLHGGIDQEIERLSRPSADPSVAATKLRLACLLRAKGDLAAAAQAANAAGNKPFAESIRVEAGQFAELAKEYESRGVAEASIEEMGYVMAYHRLAGEQDAVERWSKKIVEYARGNPANHRDAAEALFLNERPKEALEMLADMRDPLLVMEYVGPRFDFKLAEQLVQKAQEDASGDLTRLMAKAAPLLHHQGRTKEAQDRLIAISKGEHGPVDLECWEELVEAAPLSGITTEQVDAWMAQALTTIPRAQQSGNLFRKARFIDPVRAQTWWEILRDHRMAMTPAEAITTARRLDRGLIKGEEFNTLLAKVKEYAQALPRPERVRRMSAVADILSTADRSDEALAIYEGLIPPEGAVTDLMQVHMAIGDLHLKAKRWEKAAHAYGDAGKIDASDPRPVALEGWAMTQLGKIDEGKRLMDLAHLMPLGDEMVRNEFANALGQRGLAAEARRERELIVRLGNPKAWGYADGLRRLAGDVNRTDPTAAAAMWERAFLANLSTQMSFVDPTANLTIPVLIRRTKAIGRIRAGKFAEAVEDARVCLDSYPSDADSQIAIVRELDKAGKKAEADAVYKEAFDRFEAIRKEYPESGQANNLVAWLTGCVKRDLDLALQCAKRGVELEPNNTAILDTLSEVYFARGEYDEALKINEKCRTAEPYIDHHKKNFERFTAAKQGKKIDSDSPAVEE